MACPYFYPTVEVDFEARPRPARAPLGTIFAGFCHAVPDQPIAPLERFLYEPCNFGYGRRTCPMFPEGAAADAVRFTSRNGAVIFILERDHSPVEHGPCERIPASSILSRQALVFSQTTCSNK